MKKQFKLAALDLDGTLFNSKSTISDKNKNAIKKASAAGITFVIATGRPYSGLPLKDIKELGIQYVISSNGAAVYKIPEKECLLESCMPWQQTADLVEELLTLPIQIDLFIDGEAYTPTECKNVFENMEQLPEEIKEYIRSTRKLIPDFPTVIRQKQIHVQKITINFPFTESGDILYQKEAGEILEHYPDICYLSGGFGNLEFTQKGVSKAMGLRFLCDYLNIPLEDTLACGDSENDLDILKTAGLGIAMANAMDTVKSEITELAPSNDEDGVAALIEKWLV